MGNKALTILAGLVLSLSSASALHAANIDDDTKARQGVVRCGGNNFLRVGGTELHRTSYILRNLSSTTPITVERLTFFDATGSVLFDSSASGFPAFDNGILGPFDNVLDPNQTAQLNTNSLLNFLPDTRRPIQLEITWSAPERVLTLQVSGVRVAREFDPTKAPGMRQLAERSQGSIGCRTIDLRRH